MPKIKYYLNMGKGKNFNLAIGGAVVDWSNTPSLKIDNETRIDRRFHLQTLLLMKRLNEVKRV